MAKRAAPDEQPYRPLLDTSLVAAAVAKAGPSPVAAPAAPVAPADARTPSHTHSGQRFEVLRPGPQEPSGKGETDRPADALRPLVQKFDQEKRILFTRAETQAIDRLVTSLASRLNAQVKVSHVMRALVTLLLHAEGPLDRRAGEAGPIVRPPNGDPQALQRFEQEIARIIGAALRDAGPLR
jgi:hypothetical protein